MCRRLREPSRWARRRKRECEGPIARTTASSISPAQTHPRPAVPSPQRRPVCAGRDSGPGRTGRGAADGLSSKQGCRDAALSGVSPLGSRRLGDRLAPAPARAQQAQRGRSAGRFARRAAVGARVSPWRSGGPQAPGPAAWDERNWRVKRRERRGERLPKRALQRKVRAPVPSQPVPPSPDSLPPVFSPIAATSPLWPFRERRTRNPSVDSASETSTPAGLPNLLVRCTSLCKRRLDTVRPRARLPAAARLTTAPTSSRSRHCPCLTSLAASYLCNCECCRTRPPLTSLTPHARSLEPCPRLLARKPS